MNKAVVCSIRALSSFNLFFLIFNKKMRVPERGPEGDPERGPEEGPEGGPEGGVQVLSTPPRILLILLVLTLAMIGCSFEVSFL